MDWYATTSPTCGAEQLANTADVSPTVTMDTGDRGPADTGMVGGPTMLPTHSPTAGAPEPGWAIAVPATREPPILLASKDPITTATSNTTPAEPPGQHRSRQHRRAR